jgi:hypothetical protein
MEHPKGSDFRSCGSEAKGHVCTRFPWTPDVRLSRICVSVEQDKKVYICRQALSCRSFLARPRGPYVKTESRANTSGCVTQPHSCTRRFLRVLHQTFLSRERAVLLSLLLRPHLHLHQPQPQPQILRCYSGVIQHASIPLCRDLRVPFYT